MWRRVLPVVFILPVFLKADIRQDIDNTANSFIAKGAALISAGILSDANVKGGLPHFEAGAGVNITAFKIYNPLTHEESTFPGISPMLYARLGLFGGFSFTPLLSGLGSIELMGRISPTVVGKRENFNFEKNPFYYAIGGRIAILKDQLVPPTPALSIGVLYHQFTNLNFKFDTIHTEFKLSDLSIFAELSKNLIFFKPYLGIGYEKYGLEANYYTDNNTTPQELAKKTGSQMRYYGGLTFSLLIVHFYLEGSYIGKQFVFSVGASAGI